MTDPNRDKLLSHEVDGIREFDNALPRWWLYGFYFTIAFAAVYLVNYHVLPEPLYGKKGMLQEWQAEVAEAEARFPKATAAAGAFALRTDAESLAKGEAVFNGMRNLCHTCHRKDLGGVIGPNLTDDLWMHGCSPGETANNIKTGFPVKGMLPYGSGQPLTDEELEQVVSYIFSKRGSTPANPKAVDATRELECR